MSRIIRQRIFEMFSIFSINDLMKFSAINIILSSFNQCFINDKSKCFSASIDLIEPKPLYLIPDKTVTSLFVIGSNSLEILLRLRPRKYKYIKYKIQARIMYIYTYIHIYILMTEHDIIKRVFHYNQSIFTAKAL